VHSFPRPQERHLAVVREPAEGACPDRGRDELAGYRVLSGGGGWDVRKCQACLHSLSRVAAPPLGSYTPLGLEI
jgi:vanillate/4-hydroxybenzoate decarboxylase subunit D